MGTKLLMYIAYLLLSAGLTAWVARVLFRNGQVFLDDALGNERLARSVNPLPVPGRLTVLYDGGCPVCWAARRWLAGRVQLVPLDFVEAGSAAAAHRFPGLDHARSLAEVTVVADTGAVYTGDAAWLICLWALDGYRGLALRLARPRLRPLARRVVHAAATIREGTCVRYVHACDDACRRAGTAR